MAELNELTVRGDSLLQGNATVNGTINRETIDVDSDCMIIDFCKTLDVSKAGNFVQIDIPSGYVAMPISGLGSGASVGYVTYYDGYSGVGTLNAVINAQYKQRYNNADQEQTTNDKTLSNQEMSAIGLTPFVTGYVKVYVKTANTGTMTNPRVNIFGKLYCRKY